MTATIPSPDQAVWFIGFFPIRAYAMFILAGIIVAVWITQKRLEQRGGRPGQAIDVAVWAVPLGVLGGRVYHVVSSPQAYFGQGGEPIRALYIWEGGLGIWGGLAFGILGIWIGCRRNGVRFMDYLDAAAPGVAVAQAIGRWGNYFNNELYGAKTDLPWGLEIHCWDQGAGLAVSCPGGTSNIKGIFQPTFLYESLWCLLIALVLVLVDRRFTLARGQLSALYGMLYTLGRGVIEMLRTDPANHLLGLRLNVWTSMVVFAGSAFAFRYFGTRRQIDEPVAHDATADEAPDNPAGDDPANHEPASDEPARDDPEPREAGASQHPD